MWFPLNREEQNFVHKPLVSHLKLRGVKGLVFWHTPNGAYLGGKRTRRGGSIQGGIMKGLGVRKGVSDMILVHASKIYALELKAEDGDTSKEQDQFLEDMAAQGAIVAVAAGLDAAIAQLEGWGLLKGRVA